mgnify:CR=1 FL=1
MHAPDRQYWGLMALILLCCVGIYAVRDPRNEHFGVEMQALFKAIPASEIPSTAVRQLQQTTPGRRVALMTQMLEELSNCNPGVLPYFVSAVGRRFPDMAACMVVEAVNLQPGQVVSIVRAATIVAPEQLEAMILETARHLPDVFPLVAIAAAEQQPQSAERILAAIAAALPEAAPVLEKAMSQQVGYPVDIRQVLSEADCWLENQEAPGIARQGAVSHSPFASLQRLARIRCEKQKQRNSIDSNEPSLGQVDGNESLEKPFLPSCSEAPEVENIKKAASQAVAR